MDFERYEAEMNKIKLAGIKMRYIEAKEKLTTFAKVPNENLLVLYGMFKQIECGNIDIPRPGVFSHKARAKWEAWNDNKDKNKIELMETYADFVNSL